MKASLLWNTNDAYLIHVTTDLRIKLKLHLAPQLLTTGTLKALNPEPHGYVSANKFTQQQLKEYQQDVISVCNDEIKKWANRKRNECFTDYSTLGEILARKTS